MHHGLWKTAKFGPWLLIATVVGCDRDTSLQSGTGDRPTEDRVATADNPAATDASLPRDSKGVVGSPFASNLKGGNLKTGQDANRVPASNGSANQDQTQQGESGAQTQGGSVIGSPLEVERFSFQQKHDFRDLMQGRLHSLDIAIDGLKASPELRVQQNQKDKKSAERSAQATRQRAGNFDAVTRLDGQQNEVMRQLARVNQIPENQWDRYKATLRDQVQQLERDYQSSLQSSQQ